MIRHVFRLAAKDFKIQVKSIMNYLIISLVMILVFTLTGMSQKQMIYAIMTYAIIYGFVNKALYEDEKNNTLRLLASMPVRRDMVVYARYLSTGVFIIALCLVLIFIDRISSGYIRDESDDLAITIILAMTSMVFTIMISLYLPLAFKLGYIKAAGINRFLFLGVFAFFGAASFALSGMAKSQGADFLQKLGQLVSSLDPTAAFICLLLFVLLVYLVSMLVSIRLFRKRELF